MEVCNGEKKFSVQRLFKVLTHAELIRPLKWTGVKEMVLNAEVTMLVWRYPAANYCDTFKSTS